VHGLARGLDVGDDRIERGVALGDEARRVAADRRQAARRLPDLPWRRPSLEASED